MHRHGDCQRPPSGHAQRHAPATATATSWMLYLPIMSELNGSKKVYLAGAYSVVTTEMSAIVASEDILNDGRVVVEASVC